MEQVQSRIGASSDPKQEIVSPRQKPEQRQVVKSHDCRAVGDVLEDLNVLVRPCHVPLESVITYAREDDVEQDIDEDPETLKTSRHGEQPPGRLTMLVTKQGGCAEMFTVRSVDLGQATCRGSELRSE